MFHSSPQFLHMTIAESEEDTTADDASSSEEDSSEGTDEVADDDDREDIKLYETEEERVAFNPSVKSSQAWTQWQRELKRVFIQYIHEDKKFGKQKSNFDSYVL